MRTALGAVDPDHRRVALGAAHRLGILENNLLLAALGDESAAVRRRAVELAARIGGPSADPETTSVLAMGLVELLDDDECAEVAAFALGELALSPPAIVERLAAQARNHRDPLAREAAVAALGSLGAGEETILAAFDDIATVRRRAVIALANFEGSEVEAALRLAIEDRDWQVRQAAEDLLAAQDEGDEHCST